MKLKIAVLAGDGIGPEVTQEATHILEAGVGSARKWQSLAGTSLRLCRG